MAKRNVLSCDASVAGPSFFFQAEDGIRDRDVTGVQTCASDLFVDVGPFTDKHGNGPSTEARISALPFLTMRDIGLVNQPSPLSVLNPEADFILINDVPA